MTRDATVLLVHGAWHGAWAWDGVARRLADEGLAVAVIDLPSSGPDPSQLGDLHEDADAVRAAIDSIDGPVVVVAHSYGGAPTTQGAAGAENVEHIVYLTAFMLDEGESLFGLVGGVPPDWWVVADDEASLMPARPEEIFFNGVDEPLTASSVASLQPQSMASIKDAITAVAWRDVPTTYVIADADNAIPVPAQEHLSQRADTVHRLDCGHSPFLSHPDEVVAIICDVVRR